MNNENDENAKPMSEEPSEDQNLTKFDKEEFDILRKYKEFIAEETALLGGGEKAQEAAIAKAEAMFRQKWDDIKQRRARYLESLAKGSQSLDG